MEDSALLKAITTEIQELHEVFEEWFAGNLDNLDRVEVALGDGFSIVMPDGTLLGRKPLMQGLFNSRGSRAVKIEIRNPAVRWRGGDATIATYEEWQEEASSVTGRLSTAVFNVDDAAPNGLCWLHVHETWLRPPSDSAD